LNTPARSTAFNINDDKDDTFRIQTFIEGCRLGFLFNTFCSIENNILECASKEKGFRSILNPKKTLNTIQNKRLLCVVSNINKKKTRNMYAMNLRNCNAITRLLI